MLCCFSAYFRSAFSKSNCFLGYTKETILFQGLCGKISQFQFSYLISSFANPLVGFTFRNGYDKNFKSSVNIYADWWWKISSLCKYRWRRLFYFPKHISFEDSEISRVFYMALFLTSDFFLFSIWNEKILQLGISDRNYLCDEKTSLNKEGKQLRWATGGEFLISVRSDLWIMLPYNSKSWFRGLSFGKKCLGLLNLTNLGHSRSFLKF